MPYIDNDDAETKKRKKRESEELSARVYTHNREYFRDLDDQRRNDGLTDEQRFRRNRERDERQSQALMKRFGFGVQLQIEPDGTHYHYIIDKDGKRKKTDSRGNSLSGSDARDYQIIAVCALYGVLIPIAIGMLMAYSNKFTSIQAMLIVWLSAALLVGGIFYCFTRKSDWSSGLGALAIRVSVAIGLATLVTLGWSMGLSVTS